MNIILMFYSRCKRTKMPPRHLLPKDKHASGIFYGLPVLDHVFVEMFPHVIYFLLHVVPHEVKLKVVIIK